MNDEGRYLQIMKDYESFLGVKLVNQSVDQLRQAREERANLENQESKDAGTSGFRSSDGAASTGIYDRNSTAQSRAVSRGGANAQQTPAAASDDCPSEIRKSDLKASAMESFDSGEVKK